MQNVKLMTNIESSYGKFLDTWAKKSKKTKRVIIEEALGLYMKEVEREEIYMSYSGMKNDSEYLKEMSLESEQGMQHFLTDIQK